MISKKGDSRKKEAWKRCGADARYCYSLQLRRRDVETCCEPHGEFMNDNEGEKVGKFAQKIRRSKAVK